MSRELELAEIGLLQHHGGELVPVFELIIGGALPVVAAGWLARLRSASSRLGGAGRRPDGAMPATDAGARDGRVGPHGHPAGSSVDRSPTANG